MWESSSEGMEVRGLQNPRRQYKEAYLKETKRINLEEYQAFTISTWSEAETSEIAEMRCVLGITEEAGEVAGKVKKWLRGDYNGDVEQFRQDIQKELGDLLYYIAQLHNIYDMTLEESLIMNVEKLLSRLERNTIKGSGDDR